MDPTPTLTGAKESEAAATFFYYYGQVVHQQNMLTDSARTGGALPAVTVRLLVLVLAGASGHVH